MHERIVEAQKRLAVAKDRYESAIKAIEGQYVKPLAGAGVDAEDVSALRAQYYAFFGEAVLDPALEDRRGGEIDWNRLTPEQMHDPFIGDKGPGALAAFPPTPIGKTPKLPRVKKPRVAKGKQ